MVTELSCPECGPYLVAGMVPEVETGLYPWPTVAYRPCGTCNPVRRAVVDRYGASSPAAQDPEHDDHGYPKGWRGKRQQAPTRPSERGMPKPQPGDRLFPPIPHEVGAAIELSTEAMGFAPGSPERLARVEEIEKLADLMEQRMRRKAGRGSP